MDAEELWIGTWYTGTYHTWDADGTYYANGKQWYNDGSWAVAGDEIDPFETGTYTFDGSTLTLTTAPGPIHCRADTTGNYTVTFLDADTVTMEAISDECTGRIKVFTQQPWTRVTELSSGDSESATTQAAAPIGEGPTTEDAEKLVGTWNINTVPFTLGPDGTYETEYDSGTYTFDGSVVTLYAGNDSLTCLGTQGSYTVTFLDADTVKMDVIDDQCEGRRVSAFGELKWTRTTK